MKDNAFKLIAIFILFFCSCRNNKDLSTLDSDNYNNQQERIEKLVENIVCASEIYDAEFELFNVNGFANERNMSVPGASSWNHKFVVKIDTSNIKKWLETFTETKVAQANLEFFTEITKKRKENWKTVSEPKFYKRQNDEHVSIILYEKEGILYKSVVNL